MREVHRFFKGVSPEEVAAQAVRCPGEIVFLKFFLSSPLQAASVPQLDGAVSAVVQPPLDGSAVVLWAWYVEDAAGIERSAGVTAALDADGFEHIWHAGLTASGAGSGEQTAGILTAYEADLASRGISLADNCIRTWFYVHDIDNNYAGMVKARRENFESIGLTPQTHYIASTGICGTPAAGGMVQMDAYAVKGPFSQRYLYAPTHLNPTYEYGVTFERGVRLETAGTARVLISGTASIDNRGAVLHVGDVVAQTGRMMENVEVLLAEAGCSWSGIRQAVFYLRNASDYEKIAPLVAERCSFPYVVVLAPVCRPDWLIEMECLI